MSRWFKNIKKDQEPYSIRRLRSPKKTSKKIVKYKTLTKEQSVWTEQSLIDNSKNLKNI